MTESRELYSITLVEQPLPAPNTKRLFEHIIQFWREGCRGVVIIFDDNGFSIFKLTREKRG